MTSAPSALGVGLLERDAALSTLEDAHDAGRRGDGRLVFVSGDAGIGKSALVRAFCARHQDVRILAGGCDGLRTPRPLGPFLDIGAAAGGRFGEVVLAEESPQRVFDELATELRPYGQSIVVVEDLHWADEATLEVLGLLGRRVEQLGVLVVATYRDDELPRTHRLRLVLGDLATAPGVQRVSLAPLSRDAVAELAEPRALDADDLHARTGGNPFFVTEVLAGENAEIPATVRDAVLARAIRLSPPARELLDAVAIIPQRTEFWLLGAIVPDGLAALDECLASGMLDDASRSVAFRHELARLAIEDSISAHRRVQLNAAALQALRSPPDGRVDHARLAHHAEEADDGEAVLEFAVPAATRAAAVGAHREAAALYARALRHANGLPPSRRGALLEQHSYECYLIDDAANAIESIEQALECYRAIGNVRSEGVALGTLAKRRWCAGDTEGVEAAALESLRVLEQLGPSPDLAMAYSFASSAYMNLERAEQALAYGDRAFEVLDETPSTEALVYQLNNTGTMKLLLGQGDGLAALERSISLAATVGFEDHVGRAYIHLGWVGTRSRNFELLARLEDGSVYCLEHGLELWRQYLVAYLARGELDQGRWTEAADEASWVLRESRQPLLRVICLTTLGTIRVRRGDPDGWTLLDEARVLVTGKPDLQQVAPAAIARTEAFALAGETESAADASTDAFELARRCDAAWVVGELAFWRRYAGLDEPVPEQLPEPYAAHLSGDFARASALWRELGCPYEAALALGELDDVASLHEALGELRDLGAGPAAERVARRLRERGERGLVRGPRASTRDNPAGLTRREVEVLELVADGLRNGDIAERLFLSGRTVDHHVSAILRKLGVRTRAEASSEAVRLGVVAQHQ